MTIQREAIYSALWNAVSAAAPFATASRRLRHWSDVSPPEQPALFLSEKTQEGRSEAHATPIVWSLDADLYIYAHSSDPAAAPATILNPLIDALEAALAPNPKTGLNNLGLPQFVRHCRVEGKIETDEGVLGDQAVAIVPVKILCVAS